MTNVKDFNIKSHVKEEIILKSEELCRLCAGKTFEYSSVFLDDLHESLKVYLGLTILETDNWPKFICRQCLDTTKVCTDFLSMIRESEITLRDVYGDWRDIKTTEIKPDIEMVDIQEDPTLAVDIKIEEPPIKKRGRPRKKQDTTSDEDEKHRPRKGTKLSKSYDKELTEDSIRRIEEFFKMDCNLCQESCSKLKDLQVHYRKVHKIRGYVMCCENKLNRPYKLLQHLDFHLNPDTFKCSDCGKTFKNKFGLNLHMVNSHTPQELHKYKCSKCPKTFMSLPRLRNHAYVHVTDEEKSHICEHCSKAFPAKGNLQSHIRLMHQESSYHVCETCAKMFKSKDALHNHQKTHTGEKIEKLPCPTCEKTYTKYKLKVHLKRHNKVESDEVFRCHLCDKESTTSSALRQHIKYVHFSERKHKCNLCSSAFKRPSELREHMATHTSNQILYTCLFCPKQFNSNANKYVHQKRQHPEEYQAMRNKIGSEKDIVPPK